MHPAKVVDAGQAYFSFGEILSLPGQDLNAVIVAVGDDQPSRGVELDRVRRTGLPGPIPVLPMSRRNWPLRNLAWDRGDGLN